MAISLLFPFIITEQSTEEDFYFLFCERESIYLININSYVVIDDTK